MKVELFIAKRIISNKAYKNSVSAPIIKIGISAIAIGIVVMLIAIATGLGLQEKIREKVSAFNGHIEITNYDSNKSDESQVPISLKQEFYPKFKSVEGIKHIQGVASVFGIIRTKSDFEGVVFKGVGNDFNWTPFNEYLIEGKLPNFTSNLNNEILISSNLSKKLGVKLGEKIQVLFEKKNKNLPSLLGLKIVGIYNSGYKELDDKFCLFDIRHIRRLNKWKKDEVGAFEVFIDDFSEIEEKTNQIYKEIPSLLNAIAITQKYYIVFEWIKVFDSNTYGIIFIMIIVAGINMITALLVLILERTQMIGLLKAVGAPYVTIRNIFLYHASYLVGKGLLYGNIIGLGLLLAQKYFKIFPLNPDTYYVSEAPVYLSLDYILIVNIGTFLSCVLMLLIPSAIISKMSPVKALKFD